MSKLIQLVLTDVRELTSENNGDLVRQDSLRGCSRSRRQLQDLGMSLERINLLADCLMISHNHFHFELNSGRLLRTGRIRPE